MRTRSDPRLTPAREGQVEFRAVPNGTRHPWYDTIPCPLGGLLMDAFARHDQLEFKPYRWRDPARAHLMRALPEDLKALMLAEQAEAGDASSAANEHAIHEPKKTVVQLPVAPQIQGNEVRRIVDFSYGR